MFSINNKGDGEVQVPDAHSHTPPGADGSKDVLQILKEQSKKMERLARALSIIRQGMLRNNPGHVKDSVSEASEVLSGMLNTQKCFGERGGNPEKAGIPPRHKKDGHLPETALCVSGDTPKKLTKGEKIKKRYEKERGSCALCAGT